MFYSTGFTYKQAKNRVDRERTQIIPLKPDFAEPFCGNNPGVFGQIYITTPQHLYPIFVEKKSCHQLEDMARVSE